MAGLIVLGMVGLLTNSVPWLALYFFLFQDCLVAAVFAVLLLILREAPPIALPMHAGIGGWRAAMMLGLTVFLACLAGTWLVFDGYALTMDEFWAQFDARIFASGQLAVAVPAAWREFVPAMQPIFLMPVAGHTHWVSSYLPINALFRGIASLAGAQALVSPFWAALSTVAVYGIARRLWPDKPSAALAAALMLATSAQVLITAMTPYAMSAHLALNLTWLWLILRGGRLGHAAALVVAFLATGLHQMIFHPLFAAPFVLELWLARRWRAALFHTAGYAVIGLFWSFYPALLLHVIESATVASASAGEMGIVNRVGGLLMRFDPVGGSFVTALNLLRLFTWQSLLTVPLALAATAVAVRMGGMTRALVLGLVLTTLAIFVLLPYQAHGWGYRYLHGSVGSICLLAGLGWARRLEGGEPSHRSRYQATFFASIIVSAVVLFPLRGWQAHSFVRPYVVAEREVRTSDADIVLVDSKGVWFGRDLVRNDPLWKRRPLVFSVRDLTDEQLATLCARPRVRVFRPQEAWAAGIMKSRGERDVGAARRAAIAQCGVGNTRRGSSESPTTRIR
jgi:hypothetical protein